MKKLLILFVIPLSLSLVHAQSYNIYTIAGNGTGGYSGDGGTATAAELFGPRGIGVDALGNIYIADNGNLVIRKVNTSGIITTIAGNGSSSDTAGLFIGNGGPATAAELDGPWGVAPDGSGNLYIGDIYDERVLKVNTSGIISDFAGGGSNLGIDGWGDGGPATAADVDAPMGVELDAYGNVYSTDDDGRIREVNTSGIINCIAGIGYSSGFSGDGGPATDAEITSPTGIALDGFGNLYIADIYNNRIRKVNTNGIISTIAGDSTDGFSGDGGAATLAELSRPTGVAVDAIGNVYIVDWLNARIRMVNTGGIISTIAGQSAGGYSGDGGPATAAELSPWGIALNGSGNIYIADYGNSRIRILIPTSATGINKQDIEEEQVKVYPNPSNGVFTIQIKNKEIRMNNLEVYNTLGQKVYSSILPPSGGGSVVYPLNLSSQPNGVYLYRVLDENGSLEGDGKLIIEK